jgi:hypothetical protein
MITVTTVVAENTLKMILRLSVTTIMDSVATVKIKYLHFLCFDLNISLITFIYYKSNLI